MMLKWAALLLLILAGCSGNPLAAPTPTPTCLQEGAGALDQLRTVSREWDDAYRLANSTPRASLSGQIAALQAIRRKTEDVQVPDCMATMKRTLAESMDLSIQAFIAFLGQKPNTEVQALSQRAAERMAAFTEALGKVGLQVTPPAP